MSDDFIKDTYIYTTFDVAMYMVDVLKEKDIRFSIAKVQQLLYIVYGVYLTAYDERLLSDHPAAQYYGPFFPYLEEDLLQMDMYQVAINTNQVQEEELKKIKGDPKLNDVLEFVIYHFADLTFNELQDLLRDEDSAWKKACDRKDFRWGDYITDEDIRKAFWVEYAIYMDGY